MITIGFGALGRGQLCRNSFTGMATSPPDGDPGPSFLCE
jgi:hypothetical protein